MTMYKPLQARDDVERWCREIVKRKEDWIKNIKVSQYFAVFWYVLVCSTCLMWPKSFKPGKLHTVVDSFVVVGALTRCALLHSVYALKAARMNVQHSLIQERTLYQFGSFLVCKVNVQLIIVQ